MRGALLAAGAALAGVLALAGLRAGDSSEAPRGSEGTTSRTEAGEQERERVRLFWEHFRSATRHRVAGRQEEAAAGYTRALEFDDTHQDALYYAGNVQLELGRYAEAARAWERLVELNPSSARGHARLGDLRLCVDDGEVRDLPRARASFERALRINSEQTGPLLRLGQIALVEGRMEAAGEYFAAVLGSHATSAEAHFFSGFVAWKAGDGTAAAPHFAQAIAAGEGVQPAGPVVGEGDTRRGANPMLSDEIGCEFFRPHLEAIRGSGGEGGMEKTYRALDTALAPLRR